jgi:hypothetical protein
MSYPKQSLGPNDPLYYAPPALRDRADDRDSATSERGKDSAATPAAAHDNVALLHPAGGIRNQKPPDIFAEAVAKVQQERLEPELLDLPSFFQEHQPVGMIAKVAIAVAGAAFIAMAFVVAFPPSQDPAEESASPALAWLKSSPVPASPRKPAPTLMVSNKSGITNEPLELGVSVDPPTPGVTVVIKGMPTGAMLTAGRQIRPGEWRVPAEEISNAAIVPPTDFVGQLNLSAELHIANEPLVTAFVRPTWTPVPPPNTPPAAPSTATEPAAPVAQQPPQQPRALGASPPAAVVAPQARAEPTQELSSNEIAGLIRRAQEFVASGDIQAARALLQRAAGARDARAALLLAKTFDPTTLRQFGTGDPGSDLAQARNWYQRAREWGAPEAQRQLDALASYPRR